MVGAQGRALGGAARWASPAAFKPPEGTGQMVLASVEPEGRTAIPRGRTSLRRTPVAPDISRPDLLALDPAGSPLPGDRHANARPDDIDELRRKRKGARVSPHSLPTILRKGLTLTGGFSSDSLRPVAATGDGRAMDAVRVGAALPRLGRIRSATFTIFLVVAALLATACRT